MPSETLEFQDKVNDKRTIDMANRIYFFRTMSDGSRNRLRPMPFQTDPDGRTIMTELNTQSDMERRNAYPTGTVFASETCELRSASGNMPFYVAGDIFPVSVDRSELRNPSHEPNAEMMTEYNKYLAENGDKINTTGGPTTGVFNESATMRPVSLLQKLQKNPKYEKPTVEKDGFYVTDQVWWPLMLNLTAGGINTLFKGPQGSGKTEVVRLACERLGVPCHIYDMGSMYDPISDLLGVHRMTEKGSVFDYAQFTQDIQHEGVILLDELSRATPAVNNILMSCLDNRRTLRVEMAGASDQREIKIHPKCRFVATANLGAEFVGANQLDIALQDRFALEIEMEYMPPVEETKMLVHRFKIPMADATNIVNTATAVRDNYKKQELERSLSTRDTISAAQYVAWGMTAMQAMELVFLPLFEGTKAEGSRGIVWTTITSN